jgi:hypothetical protein
VFNRSGQPVFQSNNQFLEQIACQSARRLGNSCKALESLTIQANRPAASRCGSLPHEAAFAVGAGAADSGLAPEVRIETPDPFSSRFRLAAA